MAGLTISVQGMENAGAQFVRIVRGITAMSETRLYVGSRRPYAYGIDTGSHRKSGKLARRAGGSFYLERAYQDVIADADRDIAEGLNLVTAPGPWVITRLARWIRRLSRLYAPVGTEAGTFISARAKRSALKTGRQARTSKLAGRLRKSIHIERVGI